MTKLYLINYSNAHWCGGNLACVVEAESPEDAVLKAEYFMEETQQELFYDHYQDEDAEDYTDESAYNVDSVEEFDETHEEWQYFKDPSQSEFYPVVG